MLRSEALHQAHLPVQEGGLCLTSSVTVSGTAFIGSQARAFGREFIAASARGLPALSERLTGRPLAKKLVAVLKEVAVGASWVAIAAGTEMDGKETGGLLLDVGSHASGRCSDEEEGYCGDAQDSTMNSMTGRGSWTTETEAAPGARSESTSKAAHATDAVASAGLACSVQSRSSHARPQ